MSTKQTTNQSSSSALQYDPASKNIYGSLTGAGGGVLNQYMVNPFNNPFFNIGTGQAQRGAQQMGANAIQALMQNQKVSGLSGQAGQGFQQAQLGRIGRSTLSMGAQGNMANVMAALNRQMQATGMGMSFQPLLTGEKGQSQSVQQTSGLGTWLPQLLGTAAGMAMGGFGGAGAAAMAPAMGGTQGMMSGGYAPQISSLSSQIWNPASLAPSSSPSAAMLGLLPPP